MDWFIREPYRGHLRSHGQPIIRRLSEDDQLPVPLADLRLDLRIDDDDDGATLERMERTAADLIEARSGKVIIPGTFEVLFDAGARFKIERAPLRQVTALAFMTDKNVWTDQDLDDFRVITSAGSFEIGAFPGWTAPHFYMLEKTVRIQFRAGWETDPVSGESDGDVLISGDDAVGKMPARYRGILIALTGHFYENRELFMADKLTEIESTAGGLLNSIRTFW